jgi:hypothetical protein
MNDIGLMVAMFLLGVAFGLSMYEIITYLNYRTRMSPKVKKRKKVEPLLGVVLPPEDRK